MRISDWSSDVCSSDLQRGCAERGAHHSCDRVRHSRWSCILVGQWWRTYLGHRPPSAEHVDHRLGLRRRERSSTFWAGELGRASCRLCVCHYVYISLFAVPFNNTHSFFHFLFFL